MAEPIRLKPLVYKSKFNRAHDNTTQQMLLLKAMQVTQDPQKWRQMIGVKTVADVYRTLDKMALRKEFHSALDKQGISFDFIVKGIKDIALTGFKDGDKLKAYQTLLKSVGMEKYDGEASVGEGSWEETLIKRIEAEKAAEKAEGMLRLPTASVVPTYEVKLPVVPESVKKSQAEEEEMTSSIYEPTNKPTAN